MLDGSTDAAPDMFSLHPVATLLMNGAGSIVDGNQAAEILLTRSRASLVGTEAAALIAPANRESVARVIADAAASARIFDVELVCGGAHKIHADIIIGAEATAGGARIMALHQLPESARDRQLRPGAAAKAASAAAAMLAHEIKNPLSGIRGAAQLLGRQAVGGKSLVELICGEVDRIAALIDSMQGFTRGAPPAISALNVFPALSQAKAIAAAGFAADALFDERFDPAMPLIKGNHDALVQVLLNLVKNAREAALPGNRPTIRLTTAYRHGFGWDAGPGQGHVALPVEIAVWDDGPGISEGLSDVLFDPFVSNKPDGQGLGLALVDKLMRDMGGMVQHDRKDGWTRFRLCFQLADTGMKDSG